MYLWQQNFENQTTFWRTKVLFVGPQIPCFGFLVMSPVADPGFSPGGCANSQKCYYFSNFLPKTAWKWKNLDLRGARVPGTPLKSAYGLLWLCKPQWAASFMLAGGVCPRFTSGATPANLLAASRLTRHWWDSKLGYIMLLSHSARQTLYKLSYSLDYGGNHCNDQTKLWSENSGESWI